MQERRSDTDADERYREAFWLGVALGALGGLAGDWWGWE
jgi:hypothetical protein